MIEEKIKNRGEEMSVLEGHDRLHYLIDIAKGVEPLSAQEKIDENKIRGCASNLWVVGQVDNGTMFYKHDADAFITKGVVSIIADIFSGSTPKEIVESEVDLTTELDFGTILSGQRRNGAYNMLLKVKEYAKLWI